MDFGYDAVYALVRPVTQALGTGRKLLPARKTSPRGDSRTTSRSGRIGFVSTPFPNVVHAWEAAGDACANAGLFAAADELVLRRGDAFLPRFLVRVRPRKRAPERGASPGGGGGVLPPSPLQPRHALLEAMELEGLSLDARELVTARGFASRRAVAAARDGAFSDAYAFHRSYLDLKAAVEQHHLSVAADLDAGARGAGAEAWELGAKATVDAGDDVHYWHRRFDAFLQGTVLRVRNDKVDLALTDGERASGVDAWLVRRRGSLAPRGLFCAVDLVLAAHGVGPVVGGRGLLEALEGAIPGGHPDAACLEAVAALWQGP